MTLLIVVIVILLLLGVLGAVIEGLLWLTLFAVVFIVAAAVYGWFKLRSGSSSSSV
jgi:hypothetical protein